MFKVGETVKIKDIYGNASGNPMEVLYVDPVDDNEIWILLQTTEDDDHHFIWCEHEQGEYHVPDGVAEFDTPVRWMQEYRLLSVKSKKKKVYL